MIEIKINAETFYSDIETIAASGSSYMDAILHWTNQKGMETDYVASLVAQNPALKAHLQKEAEELHFLKKMKRVAI